VRGSSVAPESGFAASSAAPATTVFDGFGFVRSF